jgi:hypothetical protein
MVGEGITGPQEKVRESIGESGLNLLHLAIFIGLFLKKLIYFNNCNFEFFVEMKGKCCRFGLDFK